MLLRKVNRTLNLRAKFKTNHNKYIIGTLVTLIVQYWLFIGISNGKRRKLHPFSYKRKIINVTDKTFGIVVFGV